MTPNAKSLPKVYITIKNEIIPPLPSGPGVLGVLVTANFTLKGAKKHGSYSSQSEFLDAIEPPKIEEPKKEEGTEDKIISIIKQAFANGIPKVCFMKLENIGTNMDDFLGLYPEVDIMIIYTNNVADDKTNTISYLQKANANATPCLGLIGVDKDAANDKPDQDLILVTPKEALGAVAGLIGSLPYYESPTFKNLNFSQAEPFSPTKIDEILGKSILPVSKLSGRGWVVCKGITSPTTGSHEEISVRRIVHYAVRGTKLICDSFIGQLNTADGRSALRQKLIEFFTRMQRDNAIVPMENPETKKLDPAFMVEVTSTPSDFSLGIVRVALQIRPVRAMNYIDVVLNVVAS